MCHTQTQTAHSDGSNTGDRMAAQASLLCHLREPDTHSRCQMGNIKRTWDLRGPGEPIGAILLRLANCLFAMA